MTWTYTIKTGILTDGTKAIHCYSGAPGKWKNNPDFTHDIGHGAIPVGNYIIGPAFHSPKSGRATMRLTPKTGTDTFGRSGFEIHGDSISHPGAASEGCICTVTPSGFPDREYIDASPDKDLHVIPYAVGAMA